MLVVALVGALGALGTLVVVLGVPGALVVVYLGVHLECSVYLESTRCIFRAHSLLGSLVVHLGAIGAFGVNGLVGALGVPGALVGVAPGTP